MQAEDISNKLNIQYIRAVEVILEENLEITQFAQNQLSFG